LEPKIQHHLPSAAYEVAALFGTVLSLGPVTGFLLPFTSGFPVENLSKMFDTTGFATV
jgi:hypothetical protein